MKIRVLGSHLPNRGKPLALWAYHAEVYDDVDPHSPVWTCTHTHETPQLAHGCAAQWLDDSEGPVLRQQQPA